MKKRKLMIILFFLAIIAAVMAAIWLFDFSKPEIKWGVTFSQQYAKDELGLDWKKTYLAILDDLKADHIRLSAYWNHNEPAPDYYNFTDLDWQMEEAADRGVNVVLAVGQRLPRWPECHNPEWTKKLKTEEVQKRQLQFVEATIARYRNYSNVIYWQIENEPFLGVFGECPKLDEKLLEEEIKLARSLDGRPIMITDSGELSMWFKAAGTNADILGTTLYRVVYNPVIGYWRHPFPPSFYAFRAWLVKKIYKTDKIIAAELQAESWHPENINLSQMSIKQHFKSLSPEQMQKNINFTKKAGFDEAYLWGAEWWYFMKEKKDYDGYWETAKKLWN